MPKRFLIAARRLWLILPVLALLTGSALAWFSRSTVRVPLPMGGAYNAVYFDAMSGNGLSPVFTGETDTDGKRVGPYIITRPSHLYNLSKLQESAADTVIAAGHHYHFQVGLPYDSGGKLCLDERKNPDYAAAGIAAYRVYTDNIAAILTDTLDMTGYSDAYALPPIGTETQPFQSNFYGNAIVIDHLHVNAAGGQHAGMFGYVLNYELDGAVVTPLIQHFTLANPLISAAASLVPAGDAYAGYVIGYLCGGNVADIGVYNGKMRIPVTGGSAYTSDYGYIGKSTVPVFDTPGGSGGNLIDANLDFSAIANVIPIKPEYPWMKKTDADGNLTQVMISPFSTGTAAVILDDLIPDTPENNRAYNREVFDIEGSCNFYTRYSSEYRENFYFTTPVPFYKGKDNFDSSQFAPVPSPENTAESFYLTHEMVTGLWGISSEQHISFTTTGAGTFYFAYGVNSPSDSFTIQIYNQNRPATAIATYARSGDAQYTVFARALEIPAAGTYTVRVTGSQFLYMRFRMQHELGNIGDTGSVSDVDYTYATAAGYARVTDSAYVNSGVWIQFDLTAAAAETFVFDIFRPTPAAAVSCTTNAAAAVFSKKGVVTLSG